MSFSSKLIDEFTTTNVTKVGNGPNNSIIPLFALSELYANMFMKYWLLAKDKLFLDVSKQLFVDLRFEK